SLEDFVERRFLLVHSCGWEASARRWRGGGLPRRALAGATSRIEPLLRAVPPGGIPTFGLHCAPLPE
ncbi:MAG TPA: hypothetical protein VLQ93_23265, partial [Myxococcaceae bacterium]|nr:hypothetical protein [Myxococcaceae bacterium]